MADAAAGGASEEEPVPSPLRKLFTPTGYLHRRAALQWGRVKRHPEYGRDAYRCRGTLPSEIKDRFRVLLEEYPPDNAERWRDAKAFDAAPFPFPLSAFRRRSLAPWQQALWQFHDQWRMVYPLPPTVTHPHPHILAWLSPPG